MSLPFSLSRLTSTTPGLSVRLTSLSKTLAGAEGFEPPSSVLETDSLTVELTPLHESRVAGPGSRGKPRDSGLAARDYFTSLCGVCLRQRRQNFFISSRSVVVLRFFVVE